MAEGWCVSYLQCQRSWSQAVVSHGTDQLCLSHSVQLTQSLLPRVSRLECLPPMLPAEHHGSSCTSQLCLSKLAAVNWNQASKSWRESLKCCAVVGVGSSNRTRTLSEALLGNRSVVVAWFLPHQVT